MRLKGLTIVPLRYEKLPNRACHRQRFNNYQVAIQKVEG